LLIKSFVDKNEFNDNHKMFFKKHKL
jgi:hypothetical protein